MRNTWNIYLLLILQLFILLNFASADSGYTVVLKTNTSDTQTQSNSTIKEYDDSDYLTHESESVEAAMKSGSKVRVFDQRRQFLFLKTLFHGFEPIDTFHETGIILYPGGLVDAILYAPIARSMAELGYYVALANPILNLIVLETRLADSIMQYDPWKGKIKKWVIAGHSLGGAMATTYANDFEEEHDNTELTGLLQGVALLAAYPGTQENLKDKPFRVTSIYGTNDGLTTVDEIEDSKERLPSNAIFVSIDGGNHSNFYYGDSLQDNDNSAEISLEEQQIAIRKNLHKFLQLIET